jgi:hypothetical protein
MCRFLIVKTILDYKLFKLSHLAINLLGKCTVEMHDLGYKIVKLFFDLPDVGGTSDYPTNLLNSVLVFFDR